MSIPLLPKTNLSTVIRIADWTPALGGDVITSATVVAASGTTTISEIEWSNTTVKFTIAGGAAGETATYTCTITTMAGQTLNETLSLFVEAAVGPYGVSSSTKATVLEMAAEELASAGYEFDHGPDEIASWLRKLDALMLTSPYDGLGYNSPSPIGTGDQLDPSGLPDKTLQTVAVALGLRISPSWGKTMSGTTHRDFVVGENAIRTMVQTIPTMPLRRGTPVGSGNKRRSIWGPFTGPWDSATVYVGA